MKRSKFLGITASASIWAIFNAHGLPAASGYHLPKKVIDQNARITALHLLTITPLSELKKFYEEVIGFKILSAKFAELTILAGETLLTFMKIDQEIRPFYHFAFNIPENKIDAAFDWQKKKTPIVNPRPDMNLSHAPGIITFSHWNAHSVFFLDPAGNLVEYIARHDLNNAASGNFSVKDILYASEIGLIVDDVISSGNQLKNELYIPEYRPSSPGFWPIGDEYGLLLMIKKDTVWSSLANQINKTAVFNTSVTIRTKIKDGSKLPGYPYHIVAAG